MTDCFFKSVFGAWVRYLVNHASLLLALGSNVDSNLRSYVELVVVVDHVREVFILVKKSRSARNSQIFSENIQLAFISGQRTCLGPFSELLSQAH